MGNPSAPSQSKKQDDDDDDVSGRNGGTGGYWIWEGQWAFGDTVNVPSSFFTATTNPENRNSNITDHTNRSHKKRIRTQPFRYTLPSLSIPLLSSALGGKKRTTNEDPAEKGKEEEMKKYACTGTTMCTGSSRDRISIADPTQILVPSLNVRIIHNNDPDNQQQQQQEHHQDLGDDDTEDNDGDVVKSVITTILSSIVDRAIECNKTKCNKNNNINNTTINTTNDDTSTVRIGTTDTNAIAITNKERKKK